MMTCDADIEILRQVTQVMEFFGIVCYNRTFLAKYLATIDIIGEILRNFLGMSGSRYWFILHFFSFNKRYVLIIANEMCELDIFRAQTIWTIF